MINHQPRRQFLKIFYKGEVTEKYRLAAVAEEGDVEKDKTELLVKERGRG